MQKDRNDSFNLNDDCVDVDNSIVSSNDRVEASVRPLPRVGITGNEGVSNPHNTSTNVISKGTGGGYGMSGTVNKDGKEVYTIVAVRENDDTRGIEMVKLNNGQELTIDQAVDLASEGQIAGVIPIDDRLGRRYLRTFPDGDSTNDIHDLPRF